jgi:hypothetical protein
MSATIETSGQLMYVVAHDGCVATTLPATCAYATVTGPLSRDARILVLNSNNASSDTYVGITTASLGVGALCDPTSTTLTCATNRCWDNGASEFRCAATACSDGVDNDGDGKIDYPADPGCNSYASDDETDPMPPSTCSDSIDNDTSGSIDWLGDRSCFAASANTEGFCRGASVAADLTGMSLPIMVAGTTSGGSTVINAYCSYSSSPELAYSWTVPEAGRYRVQMQALASGFVPTLNVWKGGACSGAPLSCTYDYWSYRPSAEFDAAAGDVMALVADGYNGRSGPFTLTITRVR